MQRTNLAHQPAECQGVFGSRTACIINDYVRTERLEARQERFDVRVVGVRLVNENGPGRLFAAKILEAMKFRIAECLRGEATSLLPTSRFSTNDQFGRLYPRSTICNSVYDTQNCVSGTCACVRSAAEMRPNSNKLSPPRSWDPPGDSVDAAWSKKPSAWWTTSISTHHGRTNRKTTEIRGPRPSPVASHPSQPHCRTGQTPEGEIPLPAKPEQLAARSRTCTGLRHSRRFSFRRDEQALRRHEGSLGRRTSPPSWQVCPPSVGHALAWSSFSNCSHEILASYPGLNPEDIEACLAYKGLGCDRRANRPYPSHRRLIPLALQSRRPRFLQSQLPRQHREYQLRCPA